MPITVRSRHLAVAVSSLVVLGACSSNEATGPKAASIAVTPPTLTLRQKESAQITPGVLDASGALLSGTPVRFTSSDASIATVSPIGLVTSVGPAGTTTIVVTGAGLTQSVPVTVTPIPTSLRIRPTPLAVPQKGTVRLDPQVLDLVGTPIAGSVFTYASSNPAVATVGADGTVASVGPAGSASITVKSGALEEVVVAAVAPTPTTLVPQTTQIRVTPGRSTRALARVLDAVGADIANPSLSFTIGDAAVATVASDGTITGVRIGTTTLTIRSGSLTASIPVAVVTTAHPEGSAATALQVGCGTYGVVVRQSDAFLPCFGGEGLLRVTGSPLALQTITSALFRGLAVAVDATGARLFVADGEVPPRTRLAILDATTGALDGAPVALPATPWDVVVTADGRTAYVTYAGGAVAVIDVAQRRITRTFNTGTEGFHVALSADETRLYVGGRVTEITLATGVMRQFAALSGNAQDLVPSADGATLYTVVESAGTFVAFDIASGQPKWTASLPNCGPWGLAVAPDETRAYATCGGSLAVIDLETHATLPNILAPGGRLRRLAFSPDGLTLYVASEGPQVFVVR